LTGLKEFEPRRFRRAPFMLGEIMAPRHPDKTRKSVLTMHDWGGETLRHRGRHHPRRDGDVRLQLVVSSRSPRMTDASLGS
jgi:hypothetical protein